MINELKDDIKKYDLRFSPAITPNEYIEEYISEGGDNDDEFTSEYTKLFKKATNGKMDGYILLFPDDADNYDSMHQFISEVLEKKLVKKSTLTAGNDVSLMIVVYNVEGYQCFTESVEGIGYVWWIPKDMWNKYNK